MSAPDAGQIDALVHAARIAQGYAYAPYSGFRVGAAILGDDGTVVGGSNVENASYGLSICAERNAVHTAVVRGTSSIAAVAVAGPNEEPSWPCGACRQVLLEFGPDMLVISEGTGGKREERRLSELLPDAFGPDDLK
ncbi:MAG: cytidine deaminase [Actinomycetota bacterium]